MIAVFLFAAAIQIQATDHALAMPDRIPSGMTTFTLVNKGSEPHSVRFVRIGAGRTFEDFVAWQKTTAPIPDWLISSGGIGAVAPGSSEDFTAPLPPGTYAAICTYPSAGGAPHLQKGMFARLDVGPEVSSERSPEEDLTLTLHDHGFQLNAPVTQGKLMWHVRNNGSEPHQALIVRLPDGATEAQERAWVTNGSRAPRTGEPAGGIIDLAPESDAWFAVELKPGRYLLLCTMLEQEGRHFDLGMIYRFTIE